MEQKTFKSNVLKKLIELPLETAAGLLFIASNKGYSTKSYMEKVLIDHERKYKRSNKPSKK